MSDSPGLSQAQDTSLVHEEARLEAVVMSEPCAIQELRAV